MTKENNCEHKRVNYRRDGEAIGVICAECGSTDVTARVDQYDVIGFDERVRHDREYWKEIIYSRAKLLNKEQPVTEAALLRAAIDPGCPNYPDIDYYVRIQAYRLAQMDYTSRARYTEEQHLFQTIHNQRKELERLYAEIDELRASASSGDSKDS